MTLRTLLVAGFLTSLSVTAAFGQTDPSGPQLGKDTGGSTCRAGGDLTQARPVEIFCGENTQSVGLLQANTLDVDLPADATALRAAILVRGKTIANYLLTSEQLSCDEGRFLGSDDTLLFLCTLQSDRWPHILLISGSGRTVIQAEGLPNMLSVLAAAVAAASGHPIDPAEIAAGQRLLTQTLPDSVFSAEARDFALYTQAIEHARAYNSAEDFAAAETALRSALEIDTRLFGPDTAPVGLALMELALQVSNQGRFDEAASLFRRASPIIEAAPGADLRARYNSYLALDAANQRDFAKALAYARQATDERRAQLDATSKGGNAATGFSGLPTASSGELAHSLRIESEMALRLGDLASAQASAEEALWIINLEPGLALWWRADVLSLMAEVNERQGRVAQAERNLLDAIALRQKMFGDSAPVVMAHLTAGRFYAGEQLYPEAIFQFRAAMTILEKNAVARSRVVPDQLVPFIVAALAMPATPAQRATMDAEIFRATQLVNSDLADQAIARASVRFAAADPALARLVRDAQEAQRQSDQIRIDIAAELAKPDDERNTAHQTQLEKDLTTASARAGDLLANVQKNFPAFSRLANPGPVELSEVRAQLRPGEAFLSYVIGYRGSYGLLVTRDGLTLKKLGVTADPLSADIAALRHAIVPQLGKLPDFSLGNAYTLYTQLLEPFAGGLKGVDHLVIAPGPVLTNLPFSLLVSAAPSQTTTYANAAWLIRSMAVSQVPSPRAFFSLRQAKGAQVAAPQPFLGIGNPLLAGPGGESGGAALDTLAQNCRQASPMPASLLRGLAPLPDTEGEVNIVARALGGDAGSVLLGGNATEAALRAKPLDQYRIVYFATHGLLPGELHCQAEPGLVLSPPQTATSIDNDGLLEASEIAGLRLNADLVVLSACNTAAAGGGRFGGGALEGLADAFFNAGARGVLASHWEVPSAETADLMTGLFRRYGQDRQGDLSEALRQAQLDLTRTTATAHPFYWAAFTLIGDGAGTRTNANSARLGQQQNGGTL